MREDLAFSMKSGKDIFCAKIRLQYMLPLSFLGERRSKYHFMVSKES